MKIKVYMTGIFFLCLYSLTDYDMLFSQTVNLNGQITAWVSSNPSRDAVSQIGIRYIPELYIGEEAGDNLSFDSDISMDMYKSADIHNWEITHTFAKFNAYRLWVRFSTDRLETRLGLQKINFGSAVLFRPLQWFDRIDPRDPLKITAGVYGLLMRYYFQNNTNIWLWGLYHNKRLKGLDIAPTDQQTVEFGGRIQMPLLNGEAGLSYHHRMADFANFSLLSADSNFNTSVPENRLGLDGKWDVGVGIWIEGALVHHPTDIQGLNYQQALTLGIDYTFDVGNGLTTICEHFISTFAEKAFGRDKEKDFSGLSVNYPLNVVDGISAIFFLDWTTQDWYTTFTWRRIYDEWSIYLIGFRNPEKLILNQNQDSHSTFTGKGIQILVVFNH